MARRSSRRAGRMARTLAATAVAAALAFSAATAQAAPYLVFDDTPVTAGGTISYSGIAGDVLYGGSLYNTPPDPTAQSITLETVSGIGTPSNNLGVLTCVGTCTMDFFTGPNLVEGTPTLPVWTFNVGGFLTINGTLVDAGNNVVFGGGDFLFGAFDAAQFAIVQGTGSGTNPPPQTGTFTGTISAVLDQAVADFYGLDVLGLGSVTELFIRTSFNFDTKAFSGSITDSAAQYVANPVPNAIVPLPPAAFLLGAGFMGYMGLGYKRRRGESAAAS